MKKLIIAFSIVCLSFTGVMANPAVAKKYGFDEAKAMEKPMSYWNRTAKNDKPPFDKAGADKEALLKFLVDNASDGDATKARLNK